jgi:hypothetical protein
LKNEARKLNHREVVEEDRKSKLPLNWERKQERVELEDELERKKRVKEKFNKRKTLLIFFFINFKSQLKKMVCLTID